MTVEEISILISASAEQAIAQLEQVSEKVGKLTGSKPFQVLMDTVQAEEKIAALQRSVNQLLTDLSGNQTTAVELANVQTSYQSAIATLSNLKSLSRTTYEQELEYLQAIRAGMEQYSLSAQEALDLEQRLLAVQAQIESRDAQRIDSTLDGVISALTNRYTTMRDAELSAVEESKQAWETWQSDNSEAIQAQIDALDQLSQAEERATQEAEYTRNIDRLTQAIAYEQDSFNQEQLKNQLAEAQEAYEAWMLQTARADEKAALADQLTAVQNRTQAELDMLDVQADAITQAYAERLQTAALEAEAEQVLMTQSQEELLALITAFAPEYNATGQTLGQQLLEGFMERVGSVEGWTSTLNEMIATVQDSMRSALQGAAEEFNAVHTGTGSGVTITQQNTFNTPVESPAETAERIRQANVDLAMQIAGA